MCEKKLVSRDKLIEFHDKLIEIYSNYGKMEINLLPLIKYYEKYILEIDKRNKNELNKLRRKIYIDMKNTTNKEENKKLYDLYQMLKKC